MAEREPAPPQVLQSRRGLVLGRGRPPFCQPPELGGRGQVLQVRRGLVLGRGRGQVLQVRRGLVLGWPWGGRPHPKYFSLAVDWY